MMPYYPNTMDYFQQPYLPPYQQRQPQQETGLNWCLGEAGARAYFVARGCTVPIFDKDAPVVYIKTVDASGMPSMKILDYTEREAASPAAEKEYATKDELEALRSEVAAMKKKPKKEVETE